MPDLSILLTLFQLVLKDRTQLALENIALRQQSTPHSRRCVFPSVVAGAGMQVGLTARKLSLRDIFTAGLSPSCFVVVRPERPAYYKGGREIR